MFTADTFEEVYSVSKGHKLRSDIFQSENSDIKYLYARKHMML